LVRSPPNEVEFEPADWVLGVFKLEVDPEGLAELVGVLEKPCEVALLMLPHRTRIDALQPSESAGRPPQAGSGRGRSVRKPGGSTAAIAVERSPFGLGDIHAARRGCSRFVRISSAIAGSREPGRGREERWPCLRPRFLNRMR